MAKKVFKKTTLLFYDTDKEIYDYITKLAVKRRSTMQSEIMNLLEREMMNDQPLTSDPAQKAQSTHPANQALESFDDLPL